MERELPSRNLGRVKKNVPVSLFALAPSSPDYPHQLRPAPSRAFTQQRGINVHFGAPAVACKLALTHKP